MRLGAIHGFEYSAAFICSPLYVSGAELDLQVHAKETILQTVGVAHTPRHLWSFLPVLCTYANELSNIDKLHATLRKRRLPQIQIRDPSYRLHHVRS